MPGRENWSPVRYSVVRDANAKAHSQQRTALSEEDGAASRKAHTDAERQRRMSLSEEEGAAHRFTASSKSHKENRRQFPLMLAWVITVHTR